jgi:hypothetical protein
MRFEPTTSARSLYRQIYILDKWTADMEIDCTLKSTLSALFLFACSIALTGNRSFKNRS